jgi:flagellar biosynthesis/type III secretory pathway protein FliH
MEQAESLQELEEILDELEGLLDDPELEEDIALLVSSMAGKLAGANKEVPQVRTFGEAKNMLLERAERWSREWKAEGLKEGRKEGRKEGLKEGLKEGRKEGRKEGLLKGKADLLKALASHRFGDLPQSAVRRFNQADAKTLDHWSRQILDAERLEEVFDDAPR